LKQKHIAYPRPSRGPQILVHLSFS